MDWIVSIDFAILDFIQNTMVNPVLNIIMMIFSYIGEAGAIWIIAAIIMLFFRKTRATGVIMLAAMALGLLVGELCMKNIICRSRPFLVNTSVKPFIHAPLGYSFPSGHTTTSFAAAMVIAVREKRAWGITAYVLAALIAVMTKILSRPKKVKVSDETDGPAQKDPANCDPADCAGCAAKAGCGKQIFAETIKAGVKDAEAEAAKGGDEA